MESRMPWAKLAAEFALIIVGILCAFGIDAWWDARALASDRRDLLEGLRADFESNLALIDSAKIRHGLIKAAAHELMQVTGPEVPPTISPDSIGRLIFALTYRYRFRPAQGTLVSLINSGRWELLRDDALQAALAEWSFAVADLNAREEEGVEGINNRLLPRVWRFAPIRNMDMLDSAFVAVGPSRFRPGYDRLLADLYFEGAVDERWWDSHNALLMLEKLGARVDEILELIGHAGRSR